MLSAMKLCFCGITWRIFDYFSVIAWGEEIMGRNQGTRGGSDILPSYAGASLFFLLLCFDLVGD